MTHSATDRPRAKRWRGVWTWSTRRPLGLPPLEFVFGVLFLLGVLAGLAIAIWSTIAYNSG